ncbi:MAG: hypothetical protein KDD50_03325 [Bdellovibrionales bacterium]|nr:hypothetical protein [Bdellovibrionales bacterium]
MRNYFIYLIMMVTLMTSVRVFAQTSGDLIAASGYLERLIVEKYSSDLSTQVEKDQFQISAKIKLAKVKSKEQNKNPINDLQLTYLNPEELYKKYSLETDQNANYWQKFRIVSIEFFLGLKDSLGEQTKKEIQEWVQKRISTDFGRLGKISANSIKEPEKLAEPEKGPLQWAKELQGLLGNALLGLALILGVLLWKILMGGSAASSDSTVNVANKLEMQNKEGEDHTLTKLTDVEESALTGKVEKLRSQIKDILPKLSGDIPFVVSEWCQRGIDGITQVAFFAEVAGESVGKIDVPLEFRDQIKDIFKSVKDADSDVKFKNYNEIYWDLLAVINLGSDVLHQPFSFASKASTDRVNEVLMENSLEMQTIVSFFLPEEKRKTLIEGFDESKKLELLRQAAQLSEISESELLKLENQIAPSFESASSEKMIAMKTTLGKIIESLSLLETCTLLEKIEGEAMVEYKKHSPSLAFLSEWPDDALSTLFKVANTEELANFLQIRKDLQERCLTLVPPMTKAILSDDLKKPSSLKESEKEELLSGLLEKMKSLIANGEVDLERIFAKTKSTELKDAA